MGALENTLVMFASDNGASAEFVNRGDKHDQAAAPGSGGSYLCLGMLECAITDLRPESGLERCRLDSHNGGINLPVLK
ncbi:MAG TPA: hypothetical protein VNU68_10255 [Verrucomicrobiae bacterium]|jgi:arylsulfatase A-like enzyme|nr:hypothetical protein [Verrucomicrobiae bacterium]